MKLSQQPELVSSWRGLWTGGSDAPCVKPLSITQWSADRRSILKVYRGVEPSERQAREINALVEAARWGISVPAIHGYGIHEGRPWIVTGAVPGVARPIRTDGDVRRHVRQVRALTGQLQGLPGWLAPGTGWSRTHVVSSHRRLLLMQLSERCRGYAWWEALSAALLLVEANRTVYLHGDLKAEHFVDAGDVVYVVDWEACSRGPAVCDYVDVVFHIVRDLLYGGAAVRSTTVDSLAELSVPGSILAWRLIRWLDRRRPNDLDLASPDHVLELVQQVDPALACLQAVNAINTLRARGVPR